MTFQTTPGEGERDGRDGVIRLMAETLPLAGYGELYADIPGFQRPDLVKGAVRSHRPSLFCRLPRPVFLDVLMLPGRLGLADLTSRWQLFSSVAELVRGEFHVVVPRWRSGCDGRDVVKRLGDLVGVRAHFVWAV